MSTKIIKLTNKHNHPLVAKILKRIGTTVKITTDDEDEYCVDYAFPEETQSIGLLGDNAIGAVIGASMDNDDLVVVANYGDDGDWEVNVNTTHHTLQFVELHDLN